MDNSTKHFVLPSSHGPMGVSLTPEEIKVVNQMMEDNPEKYPQGAEGVLEALMDYREANENSFVKEI